MSHIWKRVHTKFKVTAGGVAVVCVTCGTVGSYINGHIKRKKEEE